MAFNFSLGGAAKPAAPAFGAPAATPGQPAGAGGFGGFGAPASSAATAPSTLFGGAAATSQPQGTAAPATGFGGFGAGAQPQISQPAAAGGTFGGFGATAASQPQAAAGGFGGFGAAAPASTAAAAAPGSTFAFGAASKPGLTATPAFGGFGGATAASTVAKPAGFGAGFGGGIGTGATSAPGGFGATLGLGLGQQQQQQQPVLTVPAGYPQQLPATPDSILRSVKEAWDPTSPNCQFKHYFYNVVHPSDVNKYAPGPMDDATLYDHATRNNPDPTTLVPALAIGFPALERRARVQEQHLMNMRVRLAEIAVTLDKLQARHAAENVAEVAEARRKLAAQAIRALKVMVKLHVVLNQGTPLRPDEANVRAAIDAAMGTLTARGGGAANVDGLGAGVGATNDDPPLVARLQALWRQVEQVPDRRVGGQQPSEAVGALQPADEQQVIQVLSHQEKGIAYLVDVVEQDKKEVDRIERALAADRERVGPSMMATGDGPAFKKSRVFY